jgi:hypothetical protein
MEPNKGEIVMYQPDETIRLEVRVENETVWLTQQQITDLFQRDRTVINRHINNVFKEGECDKESNVHFLHIPNSDKPVMYYSLDVIISVGYRVKSLNGTKFRRWANSFLIIDDVVYLFGASLKDAGKKLFAYIRMQETSPTELLSNIR